MFSSPGFVIDSLVLFYRQTELVLISAGDASRPALTASNQFVDPQLGDDNPTDLVRKQAYNGGNQTITQAFSCNA